MNKEEIEYKIKVYNIKLEKLFNHIQKRLENNLKYIDCEAFEATFKIIEGLINKIHLLENKLIEIEKKS